MYIPGCRFGREHATRLLIFTSHFVSLWSFSSRWKPYCVMGGSKDGALLVTAPMGTFGACALKHGLPQTRRDCRSRVQKTSMHLCKPQDIPGNLTIEDCNPKCLQQMSVFASPTSLSFHSFISLLQSEISPHKGYKLDGLIQKEARPRVRIKPMFKS